MEQQPFYFELEDQLKMLLTAIDGCILKRYNKNRISTDKIAVRYVYAPKQRALHDLTNKAQHITLPVVAYWVKGVSLDTKRLFNKLDGSDQYVNGELKHIPQPLPVKIDVNVSILTKFQSDMDQIISNLVTYFQPYITISWNRFNLPYLEIRNKIIWDGNISLGYPIDINESQPTRITGDTSFSIEGWLFKEDESASGEIRVIEASFSTLSAISRKIVDNIITEDNTETITISGNPLLVSCYPYNIQTNQGISVTVYGNFIRGISAAYISGSTVYPESSSILVDAFSSVRTLSSDNPPFYGIPVNFSINTENSITIDIPAPVDMGTVDVIFVNRVGYDKLTNQYSSGISVFES